MPGVAVVVGDVMTDVIVKPEGPLARGTDRRARIATLPGGSGANQAAWLGHFGVPVRFAARVGAGDVAANAASLRAFGVEPHLGADPYLPTGALVTLLDPDGERSFFTDRGANDALGPGDLPESLLDGAALLHVSGYALFGGGPRAVVRALMAAARQRGLPVTVDPASTGFLAEVGAAAFLAWTAGATLCCPNEAEATLLARTSDPAEQRRFLATAYDEVVIKRGAAGAEFVRGDSVITCPAPRVAVLDTTGAGDAFLAAFLAARLAGQSEEPCLRAAVDAGSVATTVFGGRPPRPA